MPRTASDAPLSLERGVPQYFLDDSLISETRKVTRRWLPAKIYPHPAIEPEKPWEHRALAYYGTTLHDPAFGYRMYYVQWGIGAGTPNVLLATSDDGFRWDKPDLGLVEWQGSKANNITLTPPWSNDGISVAHDPGSPQPYKMLMFSKGGEPTPKWGPAWGLHGFESEDGLRWERIGTGPLLCAGDRTNVMLTRSDGKFRAYTRHKLMFQHTGTRAVYLSESPDFVNWTEPELVLRPDLQDEPDVEYYGMSVFERNGWYFGLLEYWRSHTDEISVHLVFSRDGRNWQHPYPREPFIAPTYDWNRKWSSCSSSGPLIVNEQMAFYFGGRFVSHHHDTAHQHGVIGYASLPLDHFCAMEAHDQGQVLTKPIEWPGGDLVLNADTRGHYDSHPSMQSGWIEVEVLGADGGPLPEWSGDSKARFSGNTHSHGGIRDGRVIWPDDRSLDLLAGTTIRLRVLLTQSRLFTVTAVSPLPS